MCTPFQWLLWKHVFSRKRVRPGFDCLHFQLVTGKMPYAGVQDSAVMPMVLKGKRPSKPKRRHLEAPGMTPAVWKIAEKCWHQNANERPEVNAVLQYLENPVDLGACAHEARFSCGIGDN